MKILNKLKKLPAWAYAVIGVGLGAVLFLSKPKSTGQIAVVGPDMEEQLTQITDMEGRIGGVESGLSSAIYQIERNNELLNDSFAKLEETLLTGLGNYGSGTGPTAGYNAGDTGLAAGEPPGASTVSVLSESIDLLKSYGKMYNLTRNETWHQKANQVRADLATMGLADQLPPELWGRTKTNYDMPGNDKPATVKVQSDGRAPSGLSIGSIVKTGGGDYKITGYKPGGGYTSEKISSPAPAKSSSSSKSSAAAKVGKSVAAAAKKIASKKK